MRFARAPTNNSATARASRVFRKFRAFGRGVFLPHFRGGRCDLPHAPSGVDATCAQTGRTGVMRRLALDSGWTLTSPLRDFIRRRGDGNRRRNGGPRRLAPAPAGNAAKEPEIVPKTGLAKWADLPAHLPSFRKIPLRQAFRISTRLRGRGSPALGGAWRADIKPLSRWISAKDQAGSSRPTRRRGEVRVRDAGLSPISPPGAADPPISLNNWGAFSRGDEWETADFLRICSRQEERQHVPRRPFGDPALETPITPFKPAAIMQR